MHDARVVVVVLVALVALAAVVALIASVLVSNFVIGRMGRAGFTEDGPNDHEGRRVFFQKDDEYSFKKTTSRLSKR